MTLWITLGIALFAIAAWQWWCKKKAAAEAPPSEGIAMLLTEPRALNAQVLAASSPMSSPFHAKQARNRTLQTSSLAKSTYLSFI
ncbi:MAG: hypothetical protein FJW38_07825 [Acidobacteria bacterium]|nr:hypothetical protein [Acidobacteriota bacterium]